MNVFSRWWLDQADFTRQRVSALALQLISHDRRKDNPTHLKQWENQAWVEMSHRPTATARPMMTLLPPSSSYEKCAITLIWENKNPMAEPTCGQRLNGFSHVISEGLSRVYSDSISKFELSYIKKDLISPTLQSKPSLH
jgi:hypothetical protein